MLLDVGLAVADSVVAAERTVLNPAFITTSLEEENAHEQA